MDYKTKLYQGADTSIEKTNLISRKEHHYDYSKPTSIFLLAHSSVASMGQAGLPGGGGHHLNYARQAYTSSYLRSIPSFGWKTKKRAAYSGVLGELKWLVTRPLVLLFCGDLRRDDQLSHPASELHHLWRLFTVAVSDASLVAHGAFITALTHALS